MPLNVKHERGAAAKTVRVGDVALRDDVIPTWLYRKLPWLSYFDWHLRFWIYFDSIPHAVAWVGSVGFYLGSYFFIIGSFAASSLRILATKHNGDCGHDTYDIIVIHLFLIGTILWLPACYSQMCDAANHGYEGRYEEWLMSSCSGGKPKYNWIAWAPRSAEWWGGLLYTLGIVAFLISLSSEEINDCEGHAESDRVHIWTHYYMYMAGGIFFLLAGALYIMAWESLWLLPGIIPMSIPDIRSLRWWGLWFYFWGGVLYFYCGVFFYWQTPTNDVLSDKLYQAVFATGYGGGTVFYFIGSLFLLCRLSRARCRRSFRMIHNRLEPSTKAGSDKLLPIVPVRYSMDKAFRAPLPTFRMYSTAKAQEIIHRAMEESESGESRFVPDAFVPNSKHADKAEPEMPEHWSGFVRNSYKPYRPIHPISHVHSQAESC